MKQGIYLLTLVLFFSGQLARAQNLTDARSLGMAGSNIAITEGVEHVGGNPATLALHRDFNFEFHLLSARVMVKNNSFSLKDYDNYFTTGDSLSDSEIDALLGSIPDEGLRADALFGVKTFSFYARPFSLTFAGIGNGYVNLPKSPFELPFYGNTNRDEYNFDDLDGEGWAAGAVNFSIAFPVTQWAPDFLDYAAVGVSAKYLIGLMYGKTRNATGSLRTLDTGILADGSMEVLHSEGGRGFGMDLGFLAGYREKWTFSLDFANLFGSINWTENNEIELFQFHSDTIRLNSPDSAEFNDSDTSFATGSFTTGLPRTMRMAAAYQFRPNLIFTAAWRQGLNEKLGNTTTPRISFGTEYKPVSVIPLRAGFALGGDNGFALGLGMGIDLKFWQLNLAYLNHNFRWFRAARSVELALSTQFRF